MALYQIDLHAHTTASDGRCTPSGLVARAAGRGLRVLGIADHDTVAGIGEAQGAGQELGVEIVPAVEFSTRHEPEKHFIGIHLLGYFINVRAPGLGEVIARVQQGRIDQKVRQIKELQAFGFDVPVDEVFARASGVPGRPHIAAVLMERNPGYFESIQQVFDEYLATYARAHVPRQFALTVGQAITVVKEAGGLPVLAHPAAYDSHIDPVTAVRNARAEGIEGVEVFYPYEQGHRPHENIGASIDWVARMESLADELGLLKTGGTDFHGRPYEEVDLGEVGLTENQFAALKQGWQTLRSQEL